VSQENVEAVHIAFDAWNRGDVQTALDYIHPDVEWEENPEVYPGLDRIYRGHDGFLKRQRDAFDMWEWFKAEPQEVIDEGEHVVVVLRLRAKGRHSGIEVAMTVYDCFTFRDGKVVRHRLFGSRAEAFKAVGLKE
jgi:ketosteroid isomerase-like protein